MISSFLLCLYLSVFVANKRVYYYYYYYYYYCCCCCCCCSYRYYRYYYYITSSDVNRCQSWTTLTPASRSLTLDEHSAAKHNLRAHQRLCSSRPSCSTTGSRPQLVLGRCVCVSESRDHDKKLATKSKSRDTLP